MKSVIVLLFLYAVVQCVDPLSTDICLLPLGDSLTQGVGKHGSYRQHLHQLLLQLPSPYRVTFAGSAKQTCVPKKPNDVYESDPFQEPHEGHCGFNSRLLMTTLQAKLPLYACTPNVVLLMVGHNDGFQAARFCKLKEGELQENADSGVPQRICAEKFLTEYRQNLRSIVALLLARAAESHTTVNIFIGLNPSIRFLIVDNILHRVIAETVSMKDRRGNKSPSGVHAVSFAGWNASHSFDSTHPNEEGGRFMAEKWFAAIHLHVLPAQTAEGDAPPGSLKEGSDLGVAHAGGERLGGGHSDTAAAAEAGSAVGMHTWLVVFAVVVCGLLAYRRRRPLVYRRINY